MHVTLLQQRFSISVSIGRHNRHLHHGRASGSGPGGGWWSSESTFFAKSRLPLPIDSSLTSRWSFCGVSKEDINSYRREKEIFTSGKKTAQLELWNASFLDCHFACEMKLLICTEKSVLMLRNNNCNMLTNKKFDTKCEESCLPEFETATFARRFQIAPVRLPLVASPSHLCSWHPLVEQRH